MSPPSSLTCPRCGSEVKADQPFCAHCGSSLTKSPPATPVCGNCGAHVEEGGAFCWKCGVPLATGRSAKVPTSTTAEAISGESRRPSMPMYEAASGRIPPARAPPPQPPEIYYTGRPRSPLWAIVAIVVLSIGFIAFSGLVFSGEVDHLLGKDRTTDYIVGVNETGVILVSGVPNSFSLKLGCVDCPISTGPGEAFVVSWEVQNPLANGNVSYTTLELTPGTGWSGSISPATPFSVTPGGFQVLTLTAVAPSQAGAYFVPVTLDATES